MPRLCCTNLFRYPLTIVSKYNIPFLMDVPGRGHQIWGEIYRWEQGALFPLKYCQIIQP